MTNLQRIEKKIDELTLMMRKLVPTDMEQEQKFELWLNKKKDGKIGKSSKNGRVV